jgi:spoIIIJ-associated protein
MISVEKTGKSVEEAVKLAIEELQVSEDKVDVEILEQPNKGIFGIIGSRLARVKVTVKEEKKIVKEQRETKKVLNLDEEKIKVQKFLREVLDAMEVKAEIRIKPMNDSLYINLAGPKMGIIIGRRGQTLDSLQYLASLVVNKEREKEDYVKVVLDTEDYRRKREETLNRLAKRLAERVIKSGKKIELEPMNPYERRIIHSALQNYTEITTYSEGEEPYRKVIIALK